MALAVPLVRPIIGTNTYQQVCPLPCPRLCPCMSSSMSRYVLFYVPFVLTYVTYVLVYVPYVLAYVPVCPRLCPCMSSPMSPSVLLYVAARQSLSVLFYDGVKTFSVCWCRCSRRSMPELLVSWDLLPRPSWLQVLDHTLKSYSKSCFYIYHQDVHRFINLN